MQLSALWAKSSNEKGRVSLCYNRKDDEHMAMSAAEIYANRPISKGQRIWMNFKKYWTLHLMFAPACIYYIVFEVMPLYGLQVTFREYRAMDGLSGSPWMGITQFIKFFEYYKWTRITINTLAISTYSIAVGFPVPIILALILHINERGMLKKVVQNASYIPHFISMVVVIGLLTQIFDPVSGLIAAFCKWIGVDFTRNIMLEENSFRHLYIWSGIWVSMGWSTIMYVAALAGVSHELHEAATIDGASRLRRVFSVDLPAIMPTVAIMFIMRCGSVMSVGAEKAYLMQNDLNLNKSELISTYVYKYGLMNGQASYGSAVGLMNSVINSFMLIAVNKIANWLSDGEQGLF